MKHKQLLVSMAVVVAAAVSGLGGHTAFAVTPTCTWTGTAGDNKFSTATNWSGCNSAAPQAGDTIAIDLAKFTNDQQLQNDLNVALGGVIFSSSDNVYKGLGISSLTLADGAVVTKSSTNLSSSIIIGSLADRVYSDIIANGSVTIGVELSYKNIKASGVFTDDALNYAYSEGDTFTKLVVGPNAGSVNFFATSATPAALSFPIEYYATDSIAHLNFGGYCAQYQPNSMVCNVWAPTVWSLSGKVTLNTPMRVSGFGSNTTVNFTGQVSDPAKITKAVGASITLNIGSTAVVDPVKTTNYGSVKNTEYIEVANNETAMVAEGAVRSSAWVYQGGVLGGIGSFINGIHVDAGGFIAPGMSPGCLTADSLSLQGTYRFEIGGTTACSGYDQIKILGKSLAQGQSAVDVSQGTLSTSQYNGYTPKKGEVYVIIDNQSAQPVKDVFKGLVEGATFTQNGVLFKISYVGGDGNDITLTVVGTPTAPNTGFALLQASPMTTGIATVVAVGVLLLIGRKLQTVRK